MAGALNLAHVREKKGVTLDQIANSTKISMNCLRAIEAEEFQKLPGGVFATSYLRQYAAAIGYQEENLLAHYRHRMEPAIIPLQSLERNTLRSFVDRFFRVVLPASRA